jgi:glycoside/pentoside/hexuronide:cation symporter, GPH family
MSIAAFGVLKRRAVLGYGVFALPLGFIALPIYVHVPHLYSSVFGMPLAMVGGVLLAARLWDALIDPAIGVLSDRWPQRKRTLLVALPALALGLWGLLRPLTSTPGALWLVCMLGLVYLGYSLASVSYNAWGAELSGDVDERTSITATREGFGLVGVVIASVLPGLLSESVREGMAQLAPCFVVILAASAALTLGLAPSHAAGSTQLANRAPAGYAALLVPLRSLSFRRLLRVFAISGIAAAVPASLLLFFVADVLQAEAQSGAFLAIYFVCAALGLPVWVWAARRIGKVHAWLIAMGLSIVVFVWAGSLGAGDRVAFSVICALSGAALGADLALPPSILADVLSRDKLGAGASFGWWNFVTKLNLALAAGLALPLLQWLHYTPGVRDATGLRALAWVYMGVPVVLKLTAAWLLWRDRHQIAGLNLEN